MKSIITKVFVTLISLAVMGGVVAVSIFIYFSFDLPKISSLNDYEPAVPSVILSKDGTVLAQLGKEKRDIATMEEIPKRVVDAFLSAEDDSFYEHTGVDYWGIFRATIANLKAGRVVQGGSTITQQVAKSLLLTSERSISRKIKDFILAQRIEEKFSKEEILFLYLNQVYLGGGYYGVKAAFRGYFEKDLSEATVAEASMVAGLLVAPGRYSPYINPKRAKIRQGYVLGRMYATGKISTEEYEAALKEKIKFHIRKPTPFKAGYFTDWVRQRVVALVGEDDFLTGGYQIQTTLDWELQKVAEEQTKKNVKAVDKRQGYKGPLKQLKKEEWDDFHKSFLSEYYKEQSTFFTILENNEKEYEVIFDEKELEDSKLYFEEFRKVVPDKRIYPGFNKEAKFAEYIKEGENYKGVVEYVDNWARAVHVNIGGQYGIIPYSGFRWAHERNISEERHYWSYLIKPSHLISVGDVINVRVLNFNMRLKDLVTDQFAKYLDKKPKSQSALINKQKYMKLMLDQEPDVEGALVSIEPKTGHVVALVGGQDFEKSQFNRALQSKRQPGSAFKPILFAAALENGYTPSTIIMDSPETLGGVDASLDWKPRNYDGKFKGPVTVRDSLEHSRNVPTVKMAYDLGVDKILNFVDRIGFNATLAHDLSLSLGSFGVTLIDIVTTYGIFPNGGKRVIPKSIISIKDREGNPVVFNEKYEDLKTPEDVTPVIEAPSDSEEAEDKENLESLLAAEENKAGEEAEKEKPNPFLETLSEDQVYDRRLAYVMTNLLRGVVLHGTGRRAKSVSPFLGGKTGTTNNYVDAWFLGFSQNLVTGVWTGFDENQTLGWGETGAKSALPPWTEFMRAGVKKYGESDFRVPMGIVNVYIDKDSGKPIGAGREGAFLESFVEGTEPGAQSEDNEDLDDEDNNGPILEEDDYYLNQ
ncbi:MAG: hypothetical protein CME63_17720 [Halobacteriovoraceae bacterium]|nr:hypothetical protein [Halobacteriovoraceae bacterium]|tara:strand:- start:8800 stop:11574 length:2775 start_codon:yes stop_codon:yes gene_type:complete